MPGKAKPKAVSEAAFQKMKDHVRKADQASQEREKAKAKGQPVQAPAPNEPSGWGPIIDHLRSKGKL